MYRFQIQNEKRFLGLQAWGVTSSTNGLKYASHWGFIPGLKSLKNAVFWKYWGLNPGPSACKADALPLRYTPGATATKQTPRAKKRAQGGQAQRSHPPFGNLHSRRTAAPTVSAPPPPQRAQREGRRGHAAACPVRVHAFMQCHGRLGVRVTRWWPESL